MREGSFRKTLFFILSVHLCLLLFLYLFDGTKHLSKKMVVNTILLKESSDDRPSRSTSEIAISPTGSFPSKTDISSSELNSGSPSCIKKAEEKKIEIQGKVKEKAELSHLSKPSLDKSAQKLPSSTKDQKTSAKEDRSKIFQKNKTERQAVSKTLVEELQKNLSLLSKPLEERKKESDLKVPGLSSLEIFGLKRKLMENENGSGTFSTKSLDGDSRRSEFEGRLIDFFKSELKLPEYGEVKIKMKIKDDGKISDISILSSKNKNNEKYLKSALLDISIPWLNKYLSKREEVDITVSFTNEI